MASSVQNKFNPAAISGNSQVKVTLIPNHGSDTAAKGSEAIKSYHGLWESTIRYLNSAEGIFRGGQLMDRTPKWINAIRDAYGMQKSVPLDELSGKGFTAWTWGTTFPRIVVCWKESAEAEHEARKALTDGSTPAQAAHKAVKSFRDTTDAIAMSCWGISMASSLFPHGAALSKTFATTADGTTLAHDLASLQINAVNLKHAYQADLAGSTPEIKTALDETKSYNWIALAKDVCSCVGGIFGVIGMATGSAILPGLALVTFSWASTVFAVVRKFYEESMHNRPINFLDQRHVTLVSA